MKTFVTRIKVETLLNAFCALALTSGCIKNPAGQKGADSNVANVSITVPEAIKNMSDINGQTLITGYKIDIQKVEEPDCNFTNISKVSGMSDFKFNYSISKNCSYLITMTFGKLSGNSLTPVYFSAAEPKALNKAEVNLGNPKVSLRLNSTPEFNRDADEAAKAALAKGFNDPKSTPQPNASQSTPAPQIGKISDGWDLDLVASGQNKVLLSQLVDEAPIYVLDFSSATCISCVKFVQKIESSQDAYFQEFRATFLNPSSKCKYFTIATSLARSDDAFAQLTSWLAKFDSSSASHTYGTDFKLNGVVNSKYTSVDLSPTVMIFNKDSSNPVLDQSTDTTNPPKISDSIKNACK